MKSSFESTKDAESMQSQRLADAVRQLEVHDPVNDDQIDNSLRTQMAKASQPFPQASPFIDKVPGEIRQQILSYHVVSGQAIEITIAHGKRARRNEVPACFRQYTTGIDNISILRVC